MLYKIGQRFDSKEIMNQVKKRCLVGLVVVSATAKQEVLGSISGVGQSAIGFFHLEFLSISGISHEVWICSY